MVIAQGQILSIKLHDGLAAAGFITLAVTLTRYIDRADQIVTATIYPAICAIQGQRRALEEMYLKSNRATLLWVLPYAVGVVLFAPDLVHFVLGNQWAPAVVLLQGLAVVGAITQLGFNWFSFFRAHGDTRPPAVEAVAGAVAFLVLVPGGAAARRLSRLRARRGSPPRSCRCAVRGVFVRRLLPDVRYRQIVAPTLIPILVAAAAPLVRPGDPVGRAPHAGRRRSPSSRCSWPPTRSWRCDASATWWRAAGRDARRRRGRGRAGLSSRWATTMSWKLRPSRPDQVPWASRSSDSPWAARPPGDPRLLVGDGALGNVRVAQKRVAVELDERRRGADAEPRTAARSRTAARRAPAPARPRPDSASAASGSRWVNSEVAMTRSKAAVLVGEAVAARRPAPRPGCRRCCAGRRGRKRNGAGVSR